MTYRAVLAGDLILLIGLPMPDRSDGKSETKYIVVQIKIVGKLKTWVGYAHQLW